MKNNYVCMNVTNVLLLYIFMTMHQRQHQQPKTLKNSLSLSSSLSHTRARTHMHIHTHTHIHIHTCLNDALMMLYDKKNDKIIYEQKLEKIDKMLPRHFSACAIIHSASCLLTSLVNVTMTLKHEPPLLEPW